MSSLLRALDVALKVAPTEASVLVTGEGGTGKELIAELLHEAGKRAAGRYRTTRPLGRRLAGQWRRGRGSG